MKKNTMMRVASALLIAVLLTTSVISGTYAKYVTEGGAEDIARVAKWGVVVTGAGYLYADTYKKADTNTPGEANGNAADLSVVSRTTDAAIKGLNGKDKVVAPGTKNDDGLTITVTGQPEVDGHIKMNVRDADGNDFDALTDDIYLKAGTYALMVKVGKISAANWKANTYYTLSGGAYTVADTFSATTDYYTLHDEVELKNVAYYYPVRYKLNGTSVENDISKSSLATLIGTGDSTLKVDFKANTDLSTGLNLDGNDHNYVKITWEWLFEQATPNTAMFNGADTILGHLAAGFTTAGDACVVKVDGTTISLPTAQADYNITSSIQMLVNVSQTD